jgi:hypothetical protein
MPSDISRNCNYAPTAIGTKRNEYAGENHHSIAGYDSAKILISKENDREFKNRTPKIIGTIRVDNSMVRRQMSSFKKNYTFISKK